MPGSRRAGPVCSSVRPERQLHPIHHLPAEQRREGGLGIAMMRKIMSRVEYARTEDGKNILTLWKQEDA